jgi:hypothetical protein
MQAGKNQQNMVSPGFSFGIKNVQIEVKLFGWRLKLKREELGDILKKLTPKTNRV